jgi:Uma2 family endonuclease
MGTKTLMTIGQFLQLPDEESRRYELWQGELVDVGETIFDHNWIREALFFCLKQFLLATGRGGEVLVETGIQFDSNTLARPDLSYWDAPHLARIDRRRSPVEVVPQLLAEIVSPSNSLVELFRNAEYFIRSGTLVCYTAHHLIFVAGPLTSGNPDPQACTAVRPSTAKSPTSQNARLTGS